MAADLSLRSGGCIKFDLKAWDEGIHHSLCGVTNAKTMENFKILAALTEKRPNPPLLVVRVAGRTLIYCYAETDIFNILDNLSCSSPTHELPKNIINFRPVL